MFIRIKKFIIGGVLVLILILLAIIINYYFRPSMHQTTSVVKIRVTTSFYPLYFMAQTIGGQHATVINITPTGAEPHDYEPTPANMMQIENSQLLILNGGNLEAWGPNIQQIINPKRTRLVIAAKGLTNQKINKDGQTIVDPHVWLSPVLAQKMVDRITTGFISVDPNNRVYYQTRADKLKDQLNILNQDYLRGLQHCTKRDIVTAHAAFGYLASQYNFKQIAITGLSPAAEPSSKQLIHLIKLIRSNQIKYIFFESLVSPKLADTIAQEVGAKTLELNPIEGLTSSELAHHQNYFTEMQANLVNLRIALECK